MNIILRILNLKIWWFENVLIWRFENEEANLNEFENVLIWKFEDELFFLLII